MKKILLQMKLAVQDYLDHAVSLSLLSVGLAVVMFTAIFPMHLLTVYDANRMTALKSYNQHIIIGVIPDTSTYYSDPNLKEYIIDFIQENNDVIVGSLLTRNLITGYDDYTIVGYGSFEEFYSLPKGDNNLNFSKFGSSIETIRINGKLVTNLAKQFPYITTSGRTMVVPVSDLIVTGNTEMLIRSRIDSIGLQTLLQNFFFVDAEQELIDEFVGKLTSNNEFSVKLVDISKMINDEYESSFSFLIIFSIIILLGVLVFAISIVKLICAITDRMIKSYTLNLVVGAQLKEICIRIILLNLILISLTTIIAVSALWTAKLLPLTHWLLLQSLLYLVVFPIYPIFRLKRLNLYTNLRGDVN